jgi:hypothetical protein
MLAVNHHSTDDLLVVLGVILVLGCLAGAAYMAYLRNALACGLLVLVAIVAAFLLL